ncbi:DUF998 domain-containing protein [uncultured Marinobacter sp.]|uniref:DUF998 domain-containing protein n=2 Tax=Marinobacter TaxID=2742 RepID=UPI000C3D1DC2|nr:hypothetical protein [Halomonas sp.]PTB98410.1 hypothetical protein C9993_07835 [Marinobacter sp. Z-F4-2]|tara:strand:+ start:16810 stop:17466 length:657 start_codon:yes stop_codon:yes gene_type:complete
MESNMAREYTFSWPVRRLALLGLAGVAVFGTSIIALHLTGSGVGWTDDYVSDLANQPFGWLFMVGGFAHGGGNLALALGLRGALRPGRWRTWAVTLLGLASVGILLVALFPVEAPGQAPSVSGQLHRAAASTAFALELAALFVFSAAFRRQRVWRRRRAVSLALSAIAATALTVFVIAIQLDIAPGLAERVALAVFLVWEVWAGVQIIRPQQKLSLPA